jgi:Pin2-interacting protein X1
MDTQNAAWRDEAAKTSFGYKMMMKMGWSEGKGLGANEDGRTAHIKPEAKQDTRGV